MNKKKLTKIIVSVIGSVIVAVILILIGLGFKSIELGEVGINYNMITGSYNAQLIQPGIKYIGVSNEFLKVRLSSQAVNIQNLKCMTEDFVPVTLSVQIAYKITYTDAVNITNYLILFGEDPQSILTPIFKNSIQSIVSAYNLSSLSPFDITIFQNSLKSKIITTLAPMVSMDINATLQTITANYQNQSNSGYIASLKQQIQKYRSDIANGANNPGNYTYLIQELYDSSNVALTQLLTAQKARLAMVFSWINNSTSTNDYIFQKFRNYIESANQSFYQDAMAPAFVKNGTW